MVTESGSALSATAVMPSRRDASPMWMAVNYQAEQRQTHPKPQSDRTGLWRRRSRVSKRAWRRIHEAASLASDIVGIHRHRGIDRQRSAGDDVRAGIQGDALIREDIALEGRRGAKRRGRTDLPEDIAVVPAIDNDNGGTGGSIQRASHLKDKERIGVSQRVESESASQLRRGIEIVDARQQR